ncbi:IS1182 family transposase [Pelagibius sp. Alg239-R121]|uniref:IS1182 family transposase n=1 Tax=Pelagibius sp. Alg239-R121 TaxID=2993448 RepID=UPI0024A72513|nr:IS1182 family transposase [Pelagibius sp. Alg239-R121]
MLGPRQVVQAALFYEFNLDAHVPANHLLRQIDRFVDLSDIRSILAPYYSSTGRPSIDPELMIRMLLVGYCMGIRSERRLCEEVYLNLAYRWFCRLDLNDPVPDHSTFSKNRHGRFRESNLFRHLFNTVLTRCIVEGLVGGDDFGVDASLIKADASRYTKIEMADWSVPEQASRATQEYLDTLDDAAFGGSTPVRPKAISPADPAARYTGANGDRPFFAYSTNYLVDLDHAVIVDVDATAPIRQAEVEITKNMILRTRDRFGLYPEKLVADTAYGSAPMLGWLVEEEGIEPYIPVIDKSERRDGTFSRGDFIYDHDSDSYTCPSGKQLVQFRRTYKKPRSGVDKEGLMRYRASKKDCDSCSLKQQCCPKEPARKVLRSIHESARNMARDITKTDAYVTASYARKKVEMLFAHLKRILRLDRLRLRGPNGAKDEFILAATVQNLRKLAKLVPNNA